MKKLRFFLALVIAWMTGAVAAVAAVGDTFTANTTEGVEVTYKILTESDGGTPGTVQVGKGGDSSGRGISYSTTGTVTIPETVKRGDLTYTVTAIGDWAFNGCTHIEVVNLPSTIESLGEMSFESCGLLTAVNLPAGVSITSIPQYCFLGCVKLEGFTIPSTVTEIGDDAFDSCSSLTSIAIPASVTTIGQSAFSGCSSLSKAYITDLEAWDNVSFVNGSSHPLYCYGYPYGTINGDAVLYLNGEPVVDLAFPEGTTSINAYAYQYNSALRTLTIPSTLTDLPSSAFATTKNLTKVTINAAELITRDNYNTGLQKVFGSTYVKEFVIPEGITEIGRCTFKDIYSLTTVNIPSTVSTIGESSFSNCSSLDGITLPNAITKLSKGTFYSCASLSNITLPSELVYIYERAFDGCSSLTEITIPSKVGSINDNAFLGCSSLTKVTLNNGAWLKNMGFSSSSNLITLFGTQVTTFVIGEGSTSIARYAFSNATNNVTSVSLPSTLTYIGMHAFENTQNLSEITIPASVTFIGDYAFSKSGINSIVLPEGLTTLSTYVFSECPNLSSVTLPSDHTVIQQGCFKQCTALESITLPANITKINSYAFQGCTSLAGITIPDAITQIGNYAFDGCMAIQNLHFSNTLTSIGSYAFRDCTALTEVSTDILSPFKISNGVFPEAPQDGTRTLKLPWGCRSLYDAAGWSAYFNDFEEVLMQGCVIEDNGLTYKVITLPEGNTPGTVMVGTGSEERPGCASSMSGGVTVPSTVTITSGEGQDAISYQFDVTTLGSYAFNQCENLTRITLPSSITEIQENAITDCTSLERVYLQSATPNSTIIAEYAFNINTYTCMLVVPEGSKADYEVSDWAQYFSIIKEVGHESEWMQGDIFYAKVVLGDDFECTLPFKVLTTGENPTVQVGIRDYDNNTPLGDDDPFPSVIDIVGQSFPKLTTLPESVTFNGTTYTLTTIGAYTFYNIDGCHDFVLPASITQIGYRAFSRSGVINFHLLNSQTPPTLVMGTEEWYDETITPFTEAGNKDGELFLYVLADAVQTYVDAGWSAYFVEIRPIGGEGYEFMAKSPEGVLLKFKVTNSQEGNYTAQLSDYYNHIIPEDWDGSLTIPAKVTDIIGTEYKVNDIADCALYFWDNLKSVTISDVERIGEVAFRGCNALKSVTIGNGVKTIDECAFVYCEDLESVTLGTNVQNFGVRVFAGCTALTSVTVNMITPPNLPVYEDDGYVFDPLEDGQSRSLNVPYGCLKKYRDSDWHQFFNIITMINDKSADIVTIEPEDDYSVTFAEDLTDANGNALDLEDAVAAGVYYNLKSDDGEGFDTTDNSLVINNIISEEEMDAIVQQGFDSEARESIKDTYSGLIVQVEGKGKIEISCKTFGNGQLTVRIGTGAPTQYTSQDEETPISIDFNVTEPTLIYIYASETAVSGEAKDGRMMSVRRGKRGVDNGVKIYQLSVVPASVNFMMGDVNGDGKVDVADITALTNHLKGTTGNFNSGAADVDGSGQVTSADISALVGIILGQ